MNWNVKRFSMLNISQVILMRTDSNLCRKELTVHWNAPNSLIRSYLQPCTNSMWGDESEAVAPIIWLYQIVDAQKEEVFFPELLITLRSYEKHAEVNFIFADVPLLNKSRHVSWIFCSLPEVWLQLWHHVCGMNGLRSLHGCVHWMNMHQQPLKG